MITINKRICGGDPCIEDTRIPVHILIQYINLGCTYDELLTMYPIIFINDIQECEQYYKDNKQLIDDIIFNNN